jgi:2-polyprenyl-6-methoxyphenol hydroxylase-like FAD-dependent oxidoreductase
MFLLVMADDAPGIAESLEAQKHYLHRRFAGAGWECDAILAALDSSQELYFDDVTQIHAPRWSIGRVALLGDAAFCPSLLAGEGVGLAMTAAYVLAGELHASDGDCDAALQRYETRLRPLIARKQEAARNFARSFAPRTQMGLWLRNLATQAMAIPWVSNSIVGASLRDDFPLPDYR